MSARVIVTVLAYASIVFGAAKCSEPAAWIVGGTIPLLAVLLFKLKDDRSGLTRQNIDAPRGP